MLRISLGMQAYRDHIKSTSGSVWQHLSYGPLLEHLHRVDVLATLQHEMLQSQRREHFANQTPLFDALVVLHIEVNLMQRYG